MNLNEISYLDKSKIKCDVSGLMIDNEPISFFNNQYNYKEFYPTKNLDLFVSYDINYYPKTFTLKKFIEFEIMGAKSAIQKLRLNQSHSKNMKTNLKKLKKIKSLHDDNLYNGLATYFITKGVSSKNCISKVNEFKQIQNEYLTYEIEKLEKLIKLNEPNKITNTIKNMCLQNLVHEFNKYDIRLKNKTNLQVIAKHILILNSLSPTDEYISLKDLKQKIKMQNVIHKTRYILNFD